MSPPPAPAAQTLACLRCGGAIALHGLTPRVHCPYCALDQDVPAPRLAQLARYQRSAGALVARIEGEEAQRAEWARWYGPAGKPRDGYLAAFAIFGAMAAVYAVGMALLFAGVVDGRQLEQVLPGAIMGTFLVGMSVVAVRAASRAKRTPAVAPQVGARCPRCGGPLAFGAGKVSERCAHCGTSLVAGTAIMQEAIGAARAGLRQATMARHRLERSASANLYRASAASVMPYIVLGSFLPLTAGIAVMFTVDMIFGDGHDTPLLGLAIVWPLALVNGGLLLLIVWLRRVRRARWRAVADAVALRLGGRVGTTAEEWITWLNALWAGPYALIGLLPGPCFHAVTARLGSFSVAFDLDPVPADSRTGVPRADVLVAACLPGDMESVVVPPDILQRASAFGFTPTSCTAGFSAGGRAALRTLRRSDPQAAAESIVVVAQLLVEWATRVGATPATPMPPS